MLIEFSVENFRSFKGKTTLSFIASKLQSKKEDREVDETNIFKTKNGIELLKSAIIYGANGSGKSNLIKAILFMKSFVENSAQNSSAIEKVKTEKFKFNSSSEKISSFFEVIFILNNVVYRYGFEINDGIVDKEWLFHTSSKRESKLFYREGKIFDFTKVFSRGPDLSIVTRSNALFLSTCAQWNNDIAIALVSWFSKIVNFSNHELSKDILTPAMLNLHGNSDFFKKIITKFDLGFDDFQHQKRENLLQELWGITEEKIGGVKNAYNLFDSTLLTIHKKYDDTYNEIGSEVLDFDEYQSEGTRKLLLLISLMIVYAKHEAILLIDEFDSKLHPKILIELIKIFHSNILGDESLQFLMCVHNTILLKSQFFRRDQIWFVEKNRYNESSLYSLAEYRVRNDSSFDKDYLEGRYGAIPLLNSREIFDEIPV